MHFTVSHHRRVTKTGFFILAFLVISFAYEIPLFDLTGRYRSNPRLFDVAAILLFFYWLCRGRSHGWKIYLKGNFLLPWVWLTFFFSLSALLSIIWVPLDKYLYSLFYWFKYIEVLIVVLIVSSVPYNEKIVQKLIGVALLGAFWVSLVAILQNYGIVNVVRKLPNDIKISTMYGTLNSTLGISYYHLGMFSVLSFLLGFAMFLSSESAKSKVAAIAVMLSCVAAAILSGSKTGAFGLFIAIFLVAFRGKYRSNIVVCIVVILMLGMGAYLFKGSFVNERITQGSGGTPIQRMTHGFHTLKRVVDANGYRILLLGGSFYVVPVKDHINSYFNSDEFHYRIGYGNHNIYLFPLEQGGAGAFFCGLWLWLSIFYRLRFSLKSSEVGSFQYYFSFSVYSYFIVLLIAGLAGQFFYLGLGTENFNAYQLVIFVLAISGSKYNRKVVPNQSTYSEMDDV